MKNRKRQNAKNRWMSLWTLLLSVVLLTSCYNKGQQTPDAWDLTEQQLDSISFSTTHHYTQNYNFVVTSDQLTLSDNLPDIAFDTVYVVRGERIVVADIKMLPTDSIDSVWVKVASDQVTQGWIRESELLKGVSPDDPISQFIDIFSDVHLLVFLAFFVIVGSAYGMHRLNRHQAYIVHFRDIDSLYPMLLCILVAISATLYASIQLFGAESWRHYYFHPSLNPFALPFHLGLFVASVWAIIITGAAAVEDSFRQLPSSFDTILYLGGLAAVCAVDYVVFSIFTLYYIGYPLLIAYIVFALWKYHQQAHYRFLCGRCGAHLKQKGRCPHCGAMNV